jgi:hypothetical protein
MAVTFEQFPSEVDLHFYKGYDLSFRIDLDITISGYSFDAQVVQTGLPNIPFTITTSAYTPSGILYLSLPRTSTSGIDSGAKWYMDYTTSADELKPMYTGCLIAKDRL